MSGSLEAVPPPHWSLGGLTVAMLVEPVAAVVFRLGFASRHGSPSPRSLSLG
jgi:hypothetical protein